MQLTPGATLGPYCLGALIARGGMGAVYRATRNDGAPVALKILLTQGRRPEQVLRFEREAELTARLSHPAIVRVHGAGGAQGLHYIAMDLIDGEPLSARCGRVSPLEAARLVAQVARGIEHAHERGVLHRDIKPSNVLVRREDDQALITDFGIARALEDGSALTKTGALIGTPLYMAPEQATGKPATTATDVHGLGILLYEALTGRPPFEQPDLGAILVALTSSKATPPSGVRPETPRALDRLCLAALEKDPARRPTAGAFAAGLEEIVAGRAASPPRGHALALLIGAATVATLAAAAVTLRSPAPLPPVPGAPAKTPTPTTPTATAPTPPSTDPPWLRSLLAGGPVEALRTADEALRGDALLALDPGCRARAAKALEALDAAWRDPRATGQVMIPEESRAPMREAFERLLLIHALWRRLVPSHTLPQVRREVIDDLVFQGAIGRERGPQVVRVLVEVAPDDLQANVFYAQTGVATSLDEATLRHGLEIADAAKDGGAWAQIAVSLAQVLYVRVVDSGKAPATTAPARTAFDALLEQVLRREEEQPVLASRVLHLDANLALREERFEAAFNALDRALPLSAAPWEIRRARLTAHMTALRATGAEPHRVGALADYDGLLELAQDRADAEVSLALSATDMFDFFTREGWSEAALTVIERALDVVAPLTGAECALLRVLLIARTPLGEDRLPAALQDLLTRAQGRRDQLETRFQVERPVLQTLDRLIAVARDASARLARGTITREEVAKMIEELPGRPYLRPTYPG